MGCVCALKVAVLCLVVAILGFLPSKASAFTLEEAVSIALDSNPEIGQAIENRAAIEFELRQARGLYMPRVDSESHYGARQLDSPARRALGIDQNTLDTREVGATVSWKLFDGFARDAEVERQASRVDGASHRVFERSEFIALAISKEYFEILLQRRILKIAEDNLAFHQDIAARIAQGLRGGSYTTADAQQAEERLRAARARIVESQQDLETARIRFFKLVAQPPAGLEPYPNLAGAMPSSLDIAIGAARNSNPRVKLAEADIDAAAALVKAARARGLPVVSLEGTARSGRDIDGVEDRTKDLQARVVARWNLYNGGIDKANEQEQIRRLSEERMKLHTIYREVEEALRLAWNSRLSQIQLRNTLASQAEAGKRVVDAYREQFTAGRRTLLDVLTAQNTYFNTLVLLETSRHAEAFAVYRILASTGVLVHTLRLAMPSAAEAYARGQARVPPTLPAETMRQYSPDRGPNPWVTTIVGPTPWVATVK
jgi:outer membrane protein, adhesin transport system